ARRGVSRQSRMGEQRLTEGQGHEATTTKEALGSSEEAPSLKEFKDGGRGPNARADRWSSTRWEAVTGCRYGQTG
ncbi:hypothetical protein MMC29_006443, partial [Sticta canariensis]|nr:hypothetical protein [Sticta canariensis]